jgi:hypothetical protein
VFGRVDTLAGGDQLNWAAVRTRNFAALLMPSAALSDFRAFQLQAPQQMPDYQHKSQYLDYEVYNGGRASGQ